MGRWTVRWKRTNLRRNIVRYRTIRRRRVGGRASGTTASRADGPPPMLRGQIIHRRWFAGRSSAAGASPANGSAPEGVDRPRAGTPTAHAPAMTASVTETLPAERSRLGTEPAAPGDSSPRLRLLRYEPDPGRPAEPPTVSGPARPNTAPVQPADRGDLRRHLERVLRLALEVLDGRRPLAQLTPHLTPGTVRYMRAALALRPPLREPSRMTSLHLARPRPGAAEVAAVYRRGPRTRVAAARFERSPGPPPVWRCVALRFL